MKLKIKNTNIRVNEYYVNKIEEKKKRFFLKKYNFDIHCYI